MCLVSDNSRSLQMLAAQAIIRLWNPSWFHPSSPTVFACCQASASDSFLAGPHASLLCVFTLPYPSAGPCPSDPSQYQALPPLPLLPACTSSHTLPPLHRLPPRHTLPITSHTSGHSGIRYRSTSQIWTRMLSSFGKVSLTCRIAK